MKRSVTYALVAVISIAAWIYMKATKDAHSSLINWFTDVSPWYALMTFGSYCLAKLGYDLLTFNDYPKEIKKLEQVKLFHDFSARS